MKKTLAGILLATALCMGMTTTAFASQAIPAGTETAKLPWSYVTSNEEAPAAYPAEKLDITVSAAQDNPGASHISVDDVTVDGNPDYIEIPIPGYTKVGVYNYIITISTANVQGISRDSSTYTVGMIILASYDDNRNIVTEVGFTNASDAKITGITSTYDLGTLEVKQQVAGNLGSYDESFTVNVTFKADGADRVKSAIAYVDDGVEKSIAADQLASSSTVTVPITLKHGEAVTFSNVPAGMTYAVEENTVEGYETTIAYGDGEKTISADDNGDNKDTVTVTNTKNASIDTGVFLDNMPIVMAAAVAIAGVVALAALKRRRANR